MNNNPNNYAQWCQIFDNIENWEIGHFDLQIIGAIENGSIKWVPGVAERFAIRILTIINNRITKLNKFYNERIVTCYDPFTISSLLILFRKELLFLKRLATLEVLSEEIREVLLGEIMNYAKSFQNNLETNSKKDLSGDLKRIILNNRVDNI